MQATSASKALPTSFGFSGAGWLGVYHIGVAHALREHKLHTNARFVGSSFGAMATTLLVFEETSIIDIKERFLDGVDAVKRDPLRLFDLRTFLAETTDFALERTFPKYQEEMNRRIEVTATVLPALSSKRISTFPDYKTAKAALLASCTLTPLAGFPVELDGQWLVDGGFTDAAPVIDENTITVSPFSLCDCDITPSMFVPPVWAFAPPTRAELDAVFWLGVKDTLAWAAKAGYLTTDDSLSGLCSQTEANTALLQGWGRPMMFAAEKAASKIFWSAVRIPRAVVGQGSAVFKAAYENSFTLQPAFALMA